MFGESFQLPWYIVMLAGIIAIELGSLCYKMRQVKIHESSVHCTRSMHRLCQDPCQELPEKTLNGNYFEVHGNVTK